MAVLMTRPFTPGNFSASQPGETTGNVTVLMAANLGTMAGSFSQINEGWQGFTSGSSPAHHTLAFVSTDPITQHVQRATSPAHPR